MTFRLRAHGKHRKGVPLLQTTDERIATYLNYAIGGTADWTYVTTSQQFTMSDLARAIQREQIRQARRGFTNGA